MKTKRRRKTAATAPLTAFWDTSGIVRCVASSLSRRAHDNLSHLCSQVVWWVTSVEAISSFNRLKRDGHFSLQVSAGTRWKD